MIARTFTFLAMAGAACAQLRGPVMGYLPEDGALRTIYGIPAAGSVGDAFLPDPGFSRIEVSPDQTRTLAVAADTRALVLFNISTGSRIPVEGAGLAPERIVFSPSGTAAVLWFSAVQRIQVVSDLMATPSVRNIEASFTGAEPTGLAVSDDGQWVAGAWPGKVYAFGPDGKVSVLPVAGSAEAVCFFHGRNDVAVITPNRVIVITDIAGAVVPKVIWNKPDDPPPADPATAPPVQVAVGFATSFDNSHLTIAGNLGALATFDLIAGTSIGANCECKPAGLFPMGGSLFRLTGAKDGAMKIFDASTNDVWFVPLAAAPSLSPEGGQQ